MAITGAVKDEKFLDAEAILRLTSYGYDIFMFYLGRVSRKMPCPWRRDRSPSWGIYCYDGMWFWKDYSDEKSGTAIQFVENYFGIPYPEARRKIIRDLQLKKEYEYTNQRSPVVRWEEPGEEDKNYCHISFTTKPWTPKHHEFYAGTDVTPRLAEKYYTYAVKDAAMNHRRVRIAPGEMVWAYYCKEEDGVKLYFPERGQDEFNPKFRGNVSGTHLWNYDRLVAQTGLVPRAKGIIQKSNKDLLITALFTENVICTPNENSKLLLQDEVTDGINRLFAETWLAFGSDPDGVKKGHKVTMWTGWHHVNPHKDLLPGINDFYGLAKAYGPGAVETLLKEKGFL